MSDEQARGKELGCAADAMVRQTVAAAIEQAGYELAGETSSGRDTVELARYVQPDLIVIDNDLPWNPGIEWVQELHEAHPVTVILLVANDTSIRDRAMELGAFGVVYRSQMSEMEGALRRAGQWLADPQLRVDGERRTGKDRRWHQDWMKVTTERRSGIDRRLETSVGEPGD